MKRKDADEGDGSDDEGSVKPSEHNARCALEGRGYLQNFSNNSNEYQNS